MVCLERIQSRYSEFWPRLIFKFRFLNFFERFYGWPVKFFIELHLLTFFVTKNQMHPQKKAVISEIRASPSKLGDDPASDGRDADKSSQGRVSSSSPRKPRILGLQTPAGYRTVQAAFGIHRRTPTYKPPINQMSSSKQQFFQLPKGPRIDDQAKVHRQFAIMGNVAFKIRAEQNRDQTQ